MEKGSLLILACSKRKVTDRGSLPAIELYDGVNYRVLRRFLRREGWPAGLLIKILSAKHGLIDATDIIDPYDQLMSASRAAELRSSVKRDLKKIGSVQSVFVNVGSKYAPALNGLDSLFGRRSIQTASGGIGKKMAALKVWLEGLAPRTASFPRRSSRSQSFLYFFPDWDDYVNEPFAVEDPLGTEPPQSTRTYAHELFGKRPAYDGLLVSLAQIGSRKGALYRAHERISRAIRLRTAMRIPRELLLFGDCGAFSYAAEPRPPFTPIEAVRLYEQHGFDVGASVDHIPLSEVRSRSDDGKLSRKPLSESTRRRRLALSLANAKRFLRAWRKLHCKFVPLAVVHGLSTKSYVNSVKACLGMGYKHIAIGGLVPQSDREIMKVLASVRRSLQEYTRGERTNIWLHLFGILRPKLQPVFRTMGVSSFDSASYLRKAWLRSDQNYLASDGKTWYSTIRIPLSGSKAMKRAALKKRITEKELVRREAACLTAIKDFDQRKEWAPAVLKIIDRYGPLLERKGEENHFAEKHRLLLRGRPWTECSCVVCKSVGINVAVFRGASRNKRRGLHNTWVFYQKLIRQRDE